MIGQNFQIDLMVPKAANQEVKKSEFPKSSNTQFNSILSNAVSKTSYEKPQFKKDINTKYQEDSTKAAEQKPLYKSYKEIKQKQDEVKEVSGSDTKKTINNDSIDTKEPEAKNEGKKEVKPEESKALPNEEAAVEALSQVLGINQEDLIKIMQKLNIKPQDLTDEVKLQEVTNKLSDLLELNADQKKALGEILETLKTAVDSSTKKVNDPTLKSNNSNAAEVKTTQDKPESKKTENSKADWVKVDTSKIEVEKLEDLSEISKKLKGNIELLAKKLREQPEEMLQTIKEQVTEAVTKLEAEAAPAVGEELADNTIKVDNEKQVALKKEDSSKVSENKEDSEVKPVKAEEQAKADFYNQEEPEGNKAHEPKANVDHFKAVNLKAEHSNSNINNQGINQPQKVDNPVSDIKLQKEIPVSRNEIVNQVVEKAKVILTGDKSEMSMELKPESLGKLSLKVVTERGIVVAKFIAENQQVKETLEANMQLLKDSLEKQGLSIQNVSVSVGQDLRKNNDRQYEANDNSRSQGRSEAIRTGSINAVNVLETQKKVNSYNWSNSSINLTA